MQTATFYYEFIRSPEACTCLTSDHRRLLATALHEATDKYFKRIQPLWNETQSSNWVLMDVSHQRQIKAAHRFESRIALIEECLSACLWLDLKKPGDPKEQSLLESFIDAVATRKKEAVKVLKERVAQLTKLQIWLKETKNLTGSSFPEASSDSASRLDRVEMKAKKWSRQTKTLTVHLESSYNTLYLLFKHKSYRGMAFTCQKPVAFLKGVNAESLTPQAFPLTAQMETLVYDVATKLGLGPYFAETKLTVIETTTGSFSGSIQRRIRGAQLGLLFEQKMEREVSMSAFVKGFLISYLLGTTDGRLPNLFLSECKKRLIHFDNSRSLPHSNGCIRKWNHVHLTFRCHLLQLIQALEEIPEKSRADSFKTLSEVEPLLGEVEKIIRERAEEQQLPVEWVDTQNIMKAMAERIENLRTHFPQAETVWDFMLAAEPLWSFISALRLLIALHSERTSHLEAFLNDQEPPPEEIKRFTSMACCGEENVYTIFVQAAGCGIDPEKVKALSDQNKQLLPWIKSLLNYYHDSLYEPDSASSSLGDRYAALYRELEKKAEIDDKDVKSDPREQTSLLSSSSFVS